MSPKAASELDVLMSRPSYDGTYLPENWRAVDALVKHTREAGVTMEQACPRGFIPDVRQKSVFLAFERQAKYLLTVDADMVFPPDALLRLMEHDVDIAGALYMRKTPPFTPVAAMRDGFGYKNLIRSKPWKSGDFMEVDAVGAGFMLIKVDILRQIPQPHYNFFWDKDRKGFWSEDWWLCRQAKANGYKVWLDTGLSLGHMGSYGFTEGDLIQFMATRAQEAAMEQQAAEDGAIKDAVADREMAKIDKALIERG